MYVDSGLQASPGALDFIMSFRAGFESGSTFFNPWSTSNGVALFLVGIVPFLWIVSGFSVGAVIFHVAMKKQNRSDYVLGLRAADVARLANSEVGDIHDSLLFLKLHPDFPQLTVSGNTENSGTWSADEVLGAARVK